MQIITIIMILTQNNSKNKQLKHVKQQILDFLFESFSAGNYFMLSTTLTSLDQIRKDHEKKPQRYLN